MECVNECKKILLIYERVDPNIRILFVDIKKCVFILRKKYLKQVKNIMFFFLIFFFIQYRLAFIYLLT